MSNADKNWKNKALTEIEFDAEAVTIGARKIPVSDVLVGDEIVTSWRSGGYGTKVPYKITKVAERIPCPGHNGLHVHLNKSNCYDSRALVWVTA